MVKSLNEYIEVHVRGYKDNTLDAEVELSREYLEHPYDVKPYYGYLINILRKYNIPFKALGPLPPDPSYISVPKTLTRWKPLALIIGIFALAAFVIWFSRKSNGKGEKDVWDL
ncbi:MAG TPA: hypothetical protein VNL13_05615 [Sulfolobales archaeon]|nr:hypothetical protein [Sulfolobales archaeon]